MRKVIYWQGVSLDGFIEDTKRSLDWQIVDEELHRHMNDQARAVGIFLHGRRTYDVMVEFWPTADTNPSNPDYVIEFARIWKNVPGSYCSRTLERAEWNTRVIRENIAEEIARLKAQPGKDMSLGGAGIASTFMPLGLIDEYRLYIHPVILGGGTPVFPALERKIDLRLVETRTFASGVVLLRYQRKEEG